MTKRVGKQTILLEKGPVILSSAAVGTKKESEGPLGKEFSYIFESETAGERTWEKAESTIQREAVIRALRKADIPNEKVDLLLAGDLLNQCTGTTFAVREMQIPFVGVYGACSTMALSMAMASVLTECGVVHLSVAATSSHFCSAEKQFRMPLEYGGQRPPTAQWTATASGAAVISDVGEGPRVKAAIFGKIVDYGIRDANNMGAAMAPAACDTITRFLLDTKTTPEDYDMILTGDLGAVGSALLKELCIREHGIDIGNVHADCGMMLYDPETQDVHAGASGCGCSGSVVCSYIMRRLRERDLHRVLFVGTGALLSGVSTLQGESVPGIAHGVLLTDGGDQS